jgi:hypothetical protein
MLIHWVRHSAALILSSCRIVSDKARRVLPAIASKDDDVSKDPFHHGIDLIDLTRNGSYYVVAEKK